MLWGRCQTTERVRPVSHDVQYFETKILMEVMLRARE